MNLSNTDHCKFCDHKVVDFSKGTFCGLTNERPNFANKCSKISLNNTYKSYIKDINIEFEAVKKTKKDTYGHFVFYVFISFSIIIVAILLAKFILKKGYISTIPLVVSSLALAPLAKGFGEFNTYNTKLSIAKKKKELLDSISKLYGYTYNIDITHLKDSLGNKSYNTKLEIKRTNSSRL